MFEGLWCFFVFSFGLLFLFVFLRCFRLDAFLMALSDRMAMESCARIAIISED